ncbi:MAG TPA: single-stranded-DNA-specific exonuclease RecJ, partial [Anaerolineales bacterium]|nr:single-stranded-DNA-specific exonuclease RecJ [Anaerolineales bacterium]
APLAGENRLLVRQGLQVMNRPPDKLRREGLRAMYLSAGIKPGKLDAGTIGFVLGPRLNAAGRLESALDAYELMTTTDLYRAGQLAQQLEVQNREQQALTR